MSTLNKQKTYIEIYSIDLNGWIQLNLSQFNKLITPHMNSFGEEDEFDLNSSGLKYKLYSNTQERLSFDQINEGDFYEIQKEEDLSVKLINWYNGGLKLDSLNKDIADRIEDWNDESKIISQRFTIYTKCKVILKDEELNQVVISMNKENSQGDLITQKISLDKIRLLSDSDQNISNSLKLKKISAEYLIDKFDMNDDNINANKSTVDLSHLFVEKEIELDNVFYDYIEENKNEITIISTHMNIIFITHLLALKLKKFIHSEKIFKEIEIEKSKIENANRIIETREKRIFKYSKKFTDAIQSKILNNMNKDDFSYVINQTEDKDVEITIYEKGKAGSLKRIERDFDLKESSIEVNMKMADWITSKESKEELDRIVHTSKIIDYYIEEDYNKEERDIKIDFIGEESNLNNFKKLLQIHFAYYDKFLKMKNETENIKREINTLTNELKSSQKKEIKIQQK